jgi:hypothetical protein
MSLAATKILTGFSANRAALQAVQIFPATRRAVRHRRGTVVSFEPEADGLHGHDTPGAAGSMAPGP